MLLPYSLDLRWRVVWLHLFLLMPAKEVARLLFISERTVYRYSERFRITGDVRLFRQRSRYGPPRELSEFDELQLIQLILSRPGIYLRELQRELFYSTGNLVDMATICRVVKRMRMSRQKIKHIALQQSEILRIQFAAEMAAIDSSIVLWIDETGCDRRNALRKYGYGIRLRTTSTRRVVCKFLDVFLNVCKNMKFSESFRAIGNMYITGNKGRNI